MYATKIPSDERSLLLRLIEGEEDAFCELYAAYKNRLIYFAMRFLKSREYAEDIFQDAFTIVWQGRRFINPDLSTPHRSVRSSVDLDPPSIGSHKIDSSFIHQDCVKGHLSIRQI